MGVGDRAKRESREERVWFPLSSWGKGRPEMGKRESVYRERDARDEVRRTGIQLLHVDSLSETMAEHKIDGMQTDKD